MLPNVTHSSKCLGARLFIHRNISPPLWLALVFDHYIRFFNRSLTVPILVPCEAVNEAVHFRGGFQICDVENITFWLDIRDQIFVEHDTKTAEAIAVVGPQ